MKPQYETWIAKNIIVVKVSDPIETDSFPNASFKVARGSTSQVCKFTLVDIPCLNPYDWILLFNMLLKDEQKYEPIVAHLKQMLISYIQEAGKMDVEITIVHRKRPSVLPKEALKDFDKMKPGKIQKDGSCMIFQMKERTDADFHKVCFFLANKHIYNTSCLQYILEFKGKCRVNSKGDKKCFSDMILWYIQVRKELLSIIPKLFEVQKRTP
ncbi:unnamed protein product [Lactuca saligna]|uniref:Uncharacterized protein n=1 Tax=Lactuca saligna TaxID=75948 RepID=A0AA35YA98_LACSI|nr:unnamed protein product [Lactuca saligna]